MKRFVKDVQKYYKYSIYSAKSYLKSEVANSHLNWLWWILDPLCFMFIYAFIFTVVFAAKEQAFLAFIFVGLTIWQFFERCISQSVRLVKNNKAIVTKVYLPKFVLLFVRLLKNGFQMMISFAIVAALMIFYKVPITLNMLYIILVLATLFVITFAAGTILMHFGVYVEDLANVVKISLRLLFYMTGIFYNVAARIPSPYGWWAVRINPLALLLESARKCLLYGQAPNVKWLGAWLVAGLLVSALGIRTIYKNENSYAKVI